LPPSAGSCGACTAGRKAAVPHLKLSLCNEVLRPWPSRSNARWPQRWATTGWKSRPSRWPTTRRRWTTRRAALRATPQAQGLAISSLHWLLVRPPGCRSSRPTQALRQRTLDLLQRLIGFAAACGAQVLVHGSPAQRSPAPGQSLQMRWPR
jgi:D-psicose/D-tagatose/L-ribulose 3-epimerase